MRYEAPRIAGATYHGLAGKAVIITGGATGIGADIVRAFDAQGCRVGFVDIAAEAGAALAASLRDAHFERCDVSDVAALQAAIRALQARIGGTDVLVNNVANDDRHDVDTVTPEYFDGRVAVNLRPHFFATQAVLPAMRARGAGAIVNIGSNSWKVKARRLVVYASLKSAMTGYTRTLARELGADNIRVNCVVPGWVMTERQTSLWVDAEGEATMDREHCLPGRVFGSDIAQMVVFLAADTARMITAQEFIVDAGWA